MSDCLFCRIVRGEVPSSKVYEDDELLAFLDIAPKAPVHFLVIPKRHVEGVMDLAPEDAALMGRLVYKAQELARARGCAERGARFVINCKSDGGQTVGHLHMHVLGGRAMDWPPG